MKVDEFIEIRHFSEGEEPTVESPRQILAVRDQQACLFQAWRGLGAEEVMGTGVQNGRGSKQLSYPSPQAWRDLSGGLKPPSHMHMHTQNHTHTSTQTHNITCAHNTHYSQSHMNTHFHIPNTLRIHTPTPPTPTHTLINTNITKTHTHRRIITFTHINTHATHTHTNTQSHNTQTQMHTLAHPNISLCTFTC